MAAILTAQSASERILADWIDQQMDAAWGWGISDCTIAVADYVKALTGRDPAEALRGTYSSARGAQRIWRRFGGYLPLIRASMDRNGFVEARRVAHGDVGVVVATSRFTDVMPAIGTVAAVRVGDLWMVRAAMGVIAQDFETIAVWSLASWTQS